MSFKYGQLSITGTAVPKNKFIMTDKPYNVVAFRRLTEVMADTYERKNADYGDSFGISVRKYGPIAALTRISDKFNRIENLILGGKSSVADEAIDDTLLDLANYCIMTFMALPRNENTMEE